MILNQNLFLFLTTTSPSTMVLESVYQHLNQLHMKLALSCTPSPRTHESCTMVTTQVAKKSLPSGFMFLTQSMPSIVMLESLHLHLK